MSIKNFIPTIWSARILDALEKMLVYGSVANRDYEGEISEAGNKVRINGIGDLTISDYAGSVTFQQLQDAGLWLDIDQQKYFAFEIDDVDKAQAKPKGVLEKAMEKGGYGLRNAADLFLASKHAEAGITSGLGTEATPITVTAVNVLSTIALMKRKLDDADVPEDGRWAVVPPFIVEKLILAQVIRATDNMAVLQNGKVANLFGFEVKMSNNVANTSGAKYKILAGYSGTMTFAQQILKVEALRRENSFADGVKGLYVFGGKVVRPNTLARAICSAGTESTV